MNKQLQLLVVLLFSFVANAGLAQTKTVSGTVNDINGIPLPGVNVIVQNTSRGTQTDFDGNYIIEVSEGEVLLFSYVGYRTEDVTVGANDTINITLQEDASQLDEVLVVGYGTQSKRKVTGNIASISSEEINNVPIPSVQGALTGKAAGVQITQINGKVEGGVKMRIRGISTISSSQEPLYVLDGLPLINDNESTSEAPINPLISLNPNDIESIEILKDASSAAIYGARGTNGVVLITTKQGRAGKTKVSINASTGFSKPTNKLDWLNAEQYIELLTEANANTYGADDTYYTEEGGGFDQISNGTDWRNLAVDTDWQSLALVDGSVQDHSVSVSGGTEKTKYFISGGYNRTEAIVRGNDLERYSLRSNLDQTISDKFQVGLNIGVTKTHISRIGTDNSFATPLQAVAQAPISPAYLEGGVIPNNESTIYYNFLMEEYNGDWDSDIFRVLMNTYINYQIIPSLSFRSEFGYDNNNQTEEYFGGSLTESASTNGYAEANAVESDKYNLNNYFTYNHTFREDYDLEVVVGMSFEESSRKLQFVAGTGFPSDDLQTVASASEIVEGNSERSRYNFLSYFGRATFSLFDKYLLKGSLRYDGSSRFGADNRYGLFPAASAGWIISEEDFLKESKVLSLLKLRGSWGETGNAGIGDFASLGLFGGRSYKQRSALKPEQLANPDLKWERTTQADVGLDFGLWNNRLSGEVDYFVKKTNDLLLDEPIPGTSGFPTITRNVGSLKNSGFEFVLNSNNISTDNFNWSTSFNLSTLKNEVTELPGGDIIEGENIVRVGETISSFYIVEYAGVDPENGDALFYRNTLNADGTRDRSTTADYSEAERVILGSPYPDLIIGLTNTLRLWNFDISFTFQGEWGASLYNEGGKFQSGNMRYEDNQTIDQLNRWQQPGDITNVPQARLFTTNGQQDSSRYLDEADFIRLRNMTVGYTLPDDFSEKIHADRLRVYLTGINLLTITDYSGWDPESSYDDLGDSNIERGITFYSAPPAKTISLGFNIDF